MNNRGHMDFIGGVIYCPRRERRFKLGLAHRIYSEYACPGCGVRIPGRSSAETGGPMESENFPAQVQQARRLLALGDEAATIAYLLGRDVEVVRAVYDGGRDDRANSGAGREPAEDTRTDRGSGHRGNPSGRGDDGGSLSVDALGASVDERLHGAGVLHATTEDDLDSKRAVSMRLWRLFGWCEYCAKRRLIVFWWKEADGSISDSYCLHERKMLEDEA